jgi:hypothetical protein
LKSFTLEKLEAMQKEATEKAKQQLNIDAMNNEEENNSAPSHAPETMSFE